MKKLKFGENTVCYDGFLVVTDDLDMLERGTVFIEASKLQRIEGVLYKTEKVLRATYPNHMKSISPDQMEKLEITETIKSASGPDGKRLEVKRVSESLYTSVLVD